MWVRHLLDHEGLHTAVLVKSDCAHDVVPCLLHACRSPSGQRHYPDTAVGRVRLIQQLYAAGLPSRVVREVLPCVDSGEAQAPPALLDRLTTERVRIDQRINDLLAARDRLDDMIAGASDPESDCSHVR
ncbi:MerR family transcriptional regulator [Nonomuraea sp. KC401]|uniref:MerR family DNA-binding protein n=1 Tax=unclassified Nonomuraea TaxID=2593643 RepID=UPI0010FDAAD7|nr:MULTISPECIES: MerR family DNA-binding protein [unclassified Nonomuraea]NBE98807.1 MerR family DNA-binding protein [Nonomuraea sp. K271]TLF68683.1 MerR family transcriptional regulator [Nonomuraea sp. KC401]